MTRSIALVGTNSDKSTDRQLLSCIARHFTDKVDIKLVEIKDTPFLNKGLIHSIPTSIREKEARITAADGIIITIPEYDRSIPAASQNALERFSIGQHPFVDKPVMIVGASYGTLGSPHAQAQLRQILGAPRLRAYIMPSSEYHLTHFLQVLGESGALEDSEQIRRLEASFTDFLVFIKITSQLTEIHAQCQKEVEAFSREGLEQ